MKGEDGIMVTGALLQPHSRRPGCGWYRVAAVYPCIADCPNVLSNNPEEQSRLIEVSWDVGIDDVYKVNIMITSDRPGMMSDILNVTSEAKLNIFSLAATLTRIRWQPRIWAWDITANFRSAGVCDEPYSPHEGRAYRGACVLYQWWRR